MMLHMMMTILVVMCVQMTGNWAFFYLCYNETVPEGNSDEHVRATVPELAGDPKFKYITTQLINGTHLAGDPKRKGCGSLLGRGIINLNMEIAEVINNIVA